MNVCQKVVTTLGLSCLVASSVAMAAPKMNKEKMKIVVCDRSHNAFTGVVLESRYVGRRNDPVKVTFAGSESLKIDAKFSLEAVIHSSEKGSYVWKDGQFNDKPISYLNENPILTRGGQWGITIKNNSFVFYIKNEQISTKIPENWHRPITSHRLNAVYNGTEMQLFLGGKKVASKSVTVDIPNSPQAVYVGGRADKPAVSANQIQVDDVRVYNRALSVDEIENPLRRSQKGAVLSADIIDTKTLTIKK